MIPPYYRFPKNEMAFLMRCIFLTLLLALFVTTAQAQSTPGWVGGQILTAQQLNDAFGVKQDYSSILTSLKTLGASAPTCSIVSFSGPNALSLLNLGSGLSCAGGILSAAGGAFSLTSVTKTSNYAVQVSDAGTIFNTVGASTSVILTLPAVSGNNGLTFCFVTSVAQNLIVQTAGLDRIVVGATLGTAGGTVQSSTVQSTICLTANNAGQWVANNAPSGLWTLDGTSTVSMPTLLSYIPLNPANNLGDVSSAATSRTMLGLGSIATQAASAVAITGGSITGLSALSVNGIAIGSGNFGGAVASIAIGSGTPLGHATADHCIAIGYNALALFTQGGSAPCGNIAIGEQALALNVVGQENTAVGQYALANSTASANTAFGQAAMQQATTGAQNTALGWGALSGCPTGACSVTSTSSFNTAVGYLTLASNTTGGGNTAIGQDALFSVTTGGGNVALGYTSGQDLTTQNFTVILGNCTGSGFLSSTVYLCDGNNNITQRSNSGATWFPADNLVGFGTSAPTTVNYALSGDSGFTALNVVSGGVLLLRVNNTSLVSINSAGTEFVQPIKLDVVNTGTPAASLCIDGSGNVIKKTTSGACI